MMSLLAIFAVVYIADVAYCCQGCSACVDSRSYPQMCGSAAGDVFAYGVGGW